MSPGINVIVGPNASGKTTTARALISVIWPTTAAAHTETEAIFHLDGATWHAELFGTDAYFQRNGAPEKRPALPAAEAMGGRCNVALHDLLQIGDTEIARAIRVEAAGNCDLESAERALGFDPEPRLGRSSRDNFRTMQQEVLRIAGELDALATESARLSELDVQLNQARTASAQATLLAQAMEKRRHLEAYQTAAAAMAAFDPRLSALTGNELAQLQEKQAALEARSGQIEQALSAIEEARERIAACQLPEFGVAAAELESLRVWLEELRTAKGKLDQLSEAKVAAAAREQQARNALGTIGNAAAAELPDLNDIAGFVRDWDAVIVEKSAAQRWREWLGETAAPTDLEGLREAALILAQWLRESAPVRVAGPTWLRSALLALAAFLAVSSSAIALLVAPVAWIGLLAALALAIIAFARRAQPAAPSAPLFPSRIPPPSAWDYSTVQQRLDEIYRELAAARLAADKQRERAVVEPAWQRILERENQLETQRRAFCRRLDCEIDPRLFTTFVENVRTLREAHTSSAQLEAQLDETDRRWAAALAAISTAISPLGIAAPRDFAESRGCIEDLVRRDQDCRAAYQQKKTLEREHTQLEEQRKQIEHEITAILNRAVVPDAAVLATLLRDHGAFLTAREEERTQRGLRNAAEAFFRQHPELEHRVVDDLERERNDAVALGQKVEKLVAEKTGIETRIEEAKRRTALENAVAKRDNAKRALLDERNAKLDALAGYLVLDDLRQNIGQLAMPAVFERARNLFARFTNHAWDLVLPGRDENFRARDTASGGASRPLTELSSGTRVQLLLALRVAFVANEERGFNIKLPLLLDETLANSDDRRAQEIIAAIAELARDDRQIFYFTAQVDEVAKWRGFFSANPDVPHRIIDLSVARGLAAAADFERIAAPAAVSVRSPDGLSYEEYGAQLGVPPFDPRSEITSIHLWHICEDAATLHQLLAMGLELWGQAEDAFRQSGETKLSDTAVRLRANARLIEVLCGCWRHGRGRPLVREALTEAGVSINFIDRIWGIARSAGCDATQLLQRIQDGEVPRFRAETLERLREYCGEHGYIPRGTPLTTEAIRGRLQTLALELGVDPNRADALLAKICA